MVEHQTSNLRVVGSSPTSDEFFIELTVKALIEARTYRIEHYDHFGDAKYLENGLSELRWKSGLRVYFGRVEKKIILLLHGGGKNDQKKDIKKAQILLERYTST